MHKSDQIWANYTLNPKPECYGHVGEDSLTVHQGSCPSTSIHRTFQVRKMEVHSLYVREKQTKNYPPNLAGYFRFFVETLQDLGTWKFLVIRPWHCCRLYCWLLCFRAVTTSSKVTSESFSADNLRTSCVILVWVSLKVVFNGQQHRNMRGQIDSMIPIYDENFIVCGHEFEVTVSFQVTISILACSTYSCPKIDIYNVYCIYIYLRFKKTTFKSWKHPSIVAVAVPAGCRSSYAVGKNPNDLHLEIRWALNFIDPLIWDIFLDTPPPHKLYNPIPFLVGICLTIINHHPIFRLKPKELLNHDFAVPFHAAAPSLPEQKKSATEKNNEVIITFGAKHSLHSMSFFPVKWGSVTWPAEI